MKTLKTIKNILMGILGTAFYAFALIMTILLLNFNKFGVTEFGDKSLIILTQEVSNENYKKGDLIIAQKTRYDMINVGDEIFTYSVNSKGVATVEIGKVGEKYDKEKAISFENGASFSEEFIIGKATKTYNNYGTVLSIIESKWGFLFIVLVPGFIIFLYEIYALIVEIKYGDEDEKEDSKK
ncbi:MAG: hypothetical protein IJS56_05100 [Bacilli bacterium]|nr:hypothetical protein [Bacilli bacterium]